MSLIGTALLFAIGLLTLLLPSHDDGDTRKAVTILGTITAFVAAAWVVPAGATFYAESVEQASLGTWMLVFVVTLWYGLIPRLLIPREEQPSR
ncbi:hypothetical protein JD276_08825 [Leucobacter sp. CSA1]|uniref:Uncharacterized protein n=2 Tax=Leucobacter chromiisoli TaxID=2796471 RepID=A0A934UV64_9MICO|nr:hypothetical protein [Leucobacter chromiisoli]